MFNRRRKQLEIEVAALHREVTELKDFLLETYAAKTPILRYSLSSTRNINWKKIHKNIQAISAAPIKLEEVQVELSKMASKLPETTLGTFIAPVVEGLRIRNKEIDSPTFTYAAFGPQGWFFWATMVDGTIYNFPHSIDLSEYVVCKFQHFYGVAVEMKSPQKFDDFTISSDNMTTKGKVINSLSEWLEMRK